MTLPWTVPQPLMLAPMQGVTNRALRGVFGRTVKPDVLFTEFVRVRPKAKQMIANSDYTEALAVVPGIPLVVQVIGCAEEGVVQATRDLVNRGVEHINVNMGCPFGRMTSVLAGGGMFKAPHTVEPMLAELRKIVPGSLSVKTRTGIDDERQIFDVLPAFENAGIDFLVVHSRTVKQKYKGRANHHITREIVDRMPFAVIANGDIRDPEDAVDVLKLSGAAGLMLGRGAVADPKLFGRIRGTQPVMPNSGQRKRELAQHWSLLLTAYRDIFHGDAQIISKFRENLAHVDDQELKQWVKRFKKRRIVADILEDLAADLQ